MKVLFSSTGNVILFAGGLIAGSMVSSDVFNIYSPEGSCNYALPPLPIPLTCPTLLLLNNQIYLCFGYDYSTKVQNKKCWIYDISTSSWLLRASSTFIMKNKIGFVYQNKMYLFHDEVGKSEMYDPVKDSWNTWNTNPLHDIKIGMDECMVQLNDVVFIFGGDSAYYFAQMYNFTSNQWKNLSSMAYPHAGFGCIILPQNPNQILVLGTTYFASDLSRADIYDIANDAWIRATGSIYKRDGVQLISLGKRIFAIGGYPNGNMVEEYNYEYEYWSVAEAQLALSIFYSRLISVPAALFNFMSYGCVGTV